jgi:hypothetical protein
MALVYPITSISGKGISFLSFARQKNRAPVARMAAATAVVAFDFDRTIIDGDSDNWVITEMGLSRLFNKLRPTLPWNSLMVSILPFTLFDIFHMNSHLCFC